MSPSRQAEPRGGGSGTGAVGSGLLGSVIGLLLFVPVLGLVVGAAGGAIAAGGSRMGVGRRSAALFVLIRQGDPQRDVPEWPAEFW
ncbi:hypothetical protein K6U06_16255 [Acidiferrimicrobium sp. IK]|uniref:hypothetical protein n=1 Tax=Acidiferrimicrobium sp. IK TaxID=2871700 RepID=UPI0021CB6553|nr:hypothetical protein [Acidiferrimicrobium sp. IK]MCU4185924.1 hypothetical protein [Acidiferrimicrobium sp. IK]